MKKLIIVAVIALLSGCSTIGNRFDPAQTDALQPGVTTMADASARMGGQPIAVSTDQAGNTVAQWKWVQANALGGARAARVDIAFDPSGKMIRVTHKVLVGM
jgi:uncharacterized protein YceK